MDSSRAPGLRVLTYEGEIQPGMDWMRVIELELSEADFVAFFISPNSITSSVIKEELRIALHRQVCGEGGAMILPIILADVPDSDLPPLLRQFQWVDLRDRDVEKAVGQLVGAIHHWSAKRDRRRPAWPAG
jgi:TIR domain